MGAGDHEPGDPVGAEPRSMSAGDRGSGHGAGMVPPVPPAPPQRNDRWALVTAAGAAAVVAVVAAIFSAAAAVWAGVLTSEANDIARRAEQASVSAELIWTHAYQGHESPGMYYCEYELRVWNAGGAGTAVARHSVELGLGDETVPMEGTGERGDGERVYPATPHVWFANYELHPADAPAGDGPPGSAPSWNIEPRQLSERLLRVSFSSELPDAAIDDWPMGHESEDYRQWLEASTPFTVSVRVELPDGTSVAAAPVECGLRVRTDALR